MYPLLASAVSPEWCRTDLTVGKSGGAVARLACRLPRPWSARAICPPRCVPGSQQTRRARPARRMKQRTQALARTRARHTKRHPIHPASARARRLAVDATGLRPRRPCGRGQRAVVPVGHKQPIRSRATARADFSYLPTYLPAITRGNRNLRRRRQHRPHTPGDRCGAVLETDDQHPIRADRTRDHRRH